MLFFGCSFEFKSISRKESIHALYSFITNTIHAINCHNYDKKRENNQEYFLLSHAYQGNILNYSLKTFCNFVKKDKKF